MERSWLDQLAQIKSERVSLVVLCGTSDLRTCAVNSVRKRGRVVGAGIPMSDFPSVSYELLWAERLLVSVTNLTRQNGFDLLILAPQIGIVTQTTQYPLRMAIDAPDDLRVGRFECGAVLLP